MTVDDSTSTATGSVCWICGSDQVRPWKTGNVKDTLTPEDLQITDARYGLTLSLSRCTMCDFRFAEAADVEVLNELYSQLVDDDYVGSQSGRSIQMRWLVELVRRYHPAAKTALDVGAAAGLLVSESRKQGLDSIGVEPSHSLVEVAHRNGQEVLQGVLPHPDLAGRRFDIVFLVDVIEHVAEPVELLRLCADHLAEDGILLVVTPDVSSVAARALGRRWWHFRLAHVGYFDRKSLTRAAEQAGLQVKAWRRAKWFFPIEYAASRLESYLPVGGINRLVRRLPLVGRMFDVVIPVDFRDSYAVLLERSR